MSDLKSHRERVRQCREEMKQGVDLTARSPTHGPASDRVTPDVARIRRQIMNQFPLSRQEQVAAAKLRNVGGAGGYEAYWGIRNQRYDANGLTGAARKRGLR